MESPMSTKQKVRVAVHKPNILVDQTMFPAGIGETFGYHRGTVIAELDTLGGPADDRLAMINKYLPETQ